MVARLVRLALRLLPGQVACMAASCRSRVTWRFASPHASVASPESCVWAHATADSKFLLIVRQARSVSSGDNGVYTGSGLRGVIPYVQCVAAVFLSQVCSY
jgi:hypothetical protein